MMDLVQVVPCLTEFVDTWVMQTNLTHQLEATCMSNLSLIQSWDFSLDLMQPMNLSSWKIYRKLKFLA